uniref:Kringle domain-containing protein n=1 Tax=Branchiostoma floridae TaxID=7739 RepID=C3YDL7_BRAFL|eukprot:XP_002605476.1 hypothetical protein BRAFLDRAFT_92893 [Branchiostoma floridae]
MGDQKRIRTALMLLLLYVLWMGRGDSAITKQQALHLKITTSPYQSPPHVSSHHLTSPVTTSPHQPPPQLTLPPPHITSHHLTSPVTTSPHQSPPHLTSHHLTSPVTTSPHQSPPHLTSHSPQLESCQVGNGASYRGTVSVTQTGKTCQRWDSQTPHEHDRTPANYPARGLVDNYCRNLDDWYAIWCYTTDPNYRWDYCDVPVC